MPKPDTLLYDDVNAWTYLPPRKAIPQLKENSKYAEQLLFRYRTQLRMAQRFYLDADFVERSMDAAMDFDQVKRWTNIARLPYRNMWIEFDSRHKAAISQRRGTINDPVASPEESIRQAGMLLETLNEETGVWALTCFFGDEQFDTGVIVSGICFFLAPEGPSLTVLKPGKPWDRDGSGLWMGNPKESELQRFAHVSLGLKADTGDGWVFHPEFENRLTMSNEPLRGEVMKQRTQNLGEHDIVAAARELERATKIELNENAGIVRWLIVVLGMMNQVPTVRTYFPAQGHHMKRGRQVPYLDHNVVTLKLPKTKPIAYIVRTLNKQSDERRRHRAHMVRGHFRTIEYGKGIQCKHAPTMVENGVGICLRCEQMIRWISEKQRGDASLGWVNHDYVVEAA